MARRRRPQSVERLIEQINARLRSFNDERGNLSLRDKVRRLAQVYEHVRDLNVSVLAEEGWTARAAKERIRQYLLAHVGEVIDSNELAVVSGISEYARRIRQLRVQEGYQIISGVSDADTGIELRPDQYILIQAEPDEDAARRWQLANRIRRSGESSRECVRQYLVANVGKIVTTEELAYVANDAREFGRRVRELRTEHGYQIATRLIGRPDLAPGQYVLQSTERFAQPHDRRIPEAVQKQVFSRDENKCRLCGWKIDDWSSDDPRILELHHLEHHQHGGANTEENLVVLCSKCHDEVHAGRHEEILDRIRQTL